MTSIVGIPTTRITMSYSSQRLMTQTQYAQMAMYNIQMQLSTGHRYQMGSEDPISSLRVMSLQSLLERKAQVQSNLTTNQSFLSTSDSALSSISGFVSQIYADCLTAVETTTTTEQRRAIAQQVESVLSQLVDVGNQKFRDRYLFSGSTTQTKPFVYSDGDLIEYMGNDEKLYSYADIDLLFQTNVPGSEVFGAISEAGQSTADLNPSLHVDTPLSELRGGNGIASGSIEISDGSKKTVIDLSSAKTIGDVAVLIASNPPEGRTVEVQITNNGLQLRLVPSSDPFASENLIVREVGNGTTAADLGILDKSGSGNNWLVGEDLNPVLTKTTSLDDIVGRRALAYVKVNQEGDDFILRALTAGEAYNDVTIIFENDPAVTVGNETVTYDDSDPANKILRIGIEEGKSQIRHVVKAIQASAEATGLPFTAEFDPVDATQGRRGIEATPIGEVAGTTSGGAGVPFDRTSGLQITNGNKTYTFDFSEAETVEDLLNLINSAGAGVIAEINEEGTAIDIRSRVSGCDFTIAENGGQTARQLGVGTFTENTQLSDLNYGYGVNQWDEGSRASVTFALPGNDNTLMLTANSYGAAWNDFTVEFVAAGPMDTPGLTYDRYSRTMTFLVDPATTTLRDLADWVAADPAANADFTLTLPNDEFQTTAIQELVDLGPQRTSGADGNGTDFTITRADGVALAIDIQGCKTIEDVLERINNHPDNTPVGAGTTPGVQATLAASGNGIVLTDSSGPGRLTVANAALTTAATDLGLIPKGESSVSVTSATATASLTGRDVNPQETEGIFTALLRLRNALLKDDLMEIERSLAMLDGTTLNTTFVRAELGAREQALDTLGTRLEDENVELQSTLSLEYDADYVEVVSAYAEAVATMQATMQVTGKLYDLSLLNYL